MDQVERYLKKFTIELLATQNSARVHQDSLT